MRYFSAYVLYMYYIIFYDDSMGSYYESQLGHYNATLFFVVLQNPCGFYYANLHTFGHYKAILILYSDIC